MVTLPLPDISWPAGPLSSEEIDLGQGKMTINRRVIKKITLCPVRFFNVAPYHPCIIAVPFLYEHYLQIPFSRQIIAGTDRMVAPFRGCLLPASEFLSSTRRLEKNELFAAAGVYSFKKILDIHNSVIYIGTALEEHAVRILSPTDPRRVTRTRTGVRKRLENRWSRWQPDVPRLCGNDNPEKNLLIASRRRSQP
jgi:hypothetical protein